MIILFLIGILIYCAMAYISYEVGFKSSIYYFPVGLILALLANFIWLTIAKRTLDTKELFIYALIWDICLTLSYFVTPLVLFNLSLDIKHVIGVILIILGIIAIKI